MQETCIKCPFYLKNIISKYIIVSPKVLVNALLLEGAYLRNLIGLTHSSFRYCRAMYGNQTNLILDAHLLTNKKLNIIDIRWNFITIQCTPTYIEI